MSDLSLLPEQRRPFVRELAAIELVLMDSLVQDPTWLSPPDESVLRWALSLARISAVVVPPALSGGRHSVVEVGHASAGFRLFLHTRLAPCIVDGRVLRDGVRAQMGHIKSALIAERQALLQLFGERLPAAALDRATRKRPLALVMGGGGGTGYVYVGALAVLDEAGLVPAVISGTSMGALLGAFRARQKAFSLGNVRQLLARLSFKKVFRLFDTESRFGLPATLKLSLREVIGHEFLVDDGMASNDGASQKKRFLRMNELAIPLRVTVAGLTDGASVAAATDTGHLLDGVTGALSLRQRNKSASRVFSEIAARPARALYLGGDKLTGEFDVLDAIGFSSSVPGLIHYDILRDDPRMISLVENLMRQHSVVRLVDGGLVDNLPAREAWRAIQEQDVVPERDPFVLSLDAFAPQLTTRHMLFLPLMRIAAENGKKGRAQSHLVVTFKGVLSPLAVVPTPSEFIRAVDNGRREMAAHTALIRKMIGPIPDPPGIFAAEGERR